MSTIYVSEVYVAHILSKILGRIYTSPGFKGLKTIVDVYVELLPMKQAFPTTMSLVIAAITIPVSSTTCERTFSKMKLIKTTIRSTMSDIRLSDLCVLAVERDFNIRFEQLMDDFADSHKNSRVLLK